MTYLAYDPERIGALITAMRAALDDLASFVADDPLALDALGRVRLARVHLEQLWLPLLERIVASDPLADPTALALDDVVQSLLRAVATLPGWALAEVGTDPLGAAPTSPPMPAQAVALADVLRRGDLAELTDTAAERAWLATELTLVAGDPALAAAFAAAFDRWGALGDQLGHHRQVALDDRTQSPADDRRLDAARIDEAFAAIGAIWVGVHGSAAIPALTRTMAPYAAAALVRRTALDPDRLAWLSAELLHRLDRDRPGTWPEDRVGGPKTGDLLFQTILATPGAATAFVIAVVAEPGLLWWSAADASLAQRVALTGTDPTAIGAADAGAVLHAFAEWFAALDPLSRNNLVFTAAPLESRATLGALAAPWLVSYGPGVDDWGDDPGPRRADLAFIIDDAGARRAVFAQLAADTAGMGGDTAVHRHDQAAAAAIGMLLQLDAERTIRAGEDAKESWDGMWEMVGRAVGFVGRRGGPEVAAIAAMLDRALVEVKRVADRNGWLGAPPAPGDVAARARSAQQRILLGSAATAVMAGYLTLRAAGELPPGTPPPPVPAGDDVQAYWREYRDWREAHVPPRSEAEQVLDGQFGLFLSPAEIGARAATG